MKRILTTMLNIYVLCVALVREADWHSQRGAVVTSDFLAGLMTNFRVIFQEALDEVMAEFQLYKEISTEFPSDTDQESYGWMGANPNMREWTDQRVYKALKAYSYSLVNKHYEGTIEVDRDTYEDDKYGLIAPRVRGLPRRAVRHMNEQTISKLDAGATDLAYDGTAFFADTRTIGASANIDNLLASAYSGDAAQVRAALAVAYQTMALYQDDKGIAMGLVPDTIVCSPAMLILIRNALLPGVAGVIRTEAALFPPERVFASAWIDADLYDWYILCTKAEVKPLIFQLRKAPEFVALDDPRSDHVFKNKTFLYGVDDRFVVGYGDPRTAIKIQDA